MKIGILLKAKDDGEVNYVLRAFEDIASAKDAMLKDFADTKARSYPKDEFVCDAFCGETEAYIIGTDDSYVYWSVREAEVER